MAYFDLTQYQTVQERIDLFWEAYPNGRLHLELVSLTENQVVFKAEVFLNRDDVFPAAVDFAEERLGSSPVNKTSFVENCATSAYGRAISALGGKFSPKGKRPSQTEMQKVERLTETPNKNYLAALENISDMEGLRSLYNEAKQNKASGSILEAIKVKADGISKANTGNKPVES